jgi:RNA polymerase sigma-32 factor
VQWLGHADRSALTRYRAELSGKKSLPADVELALVAAWRAGDRRAGQRLIEACLPFVLTIAHEYRRWGIPMEDIVQEGNLGLGRRPSLRPSRGTGWSRAAYWIAEIRDFVVRAYRVVRLGSKGRASRSSSSDASRTRNRCRQQARGRAGQKLLPLLMSRDAALDADPPGSLLPSLTTPPVPEEAMVQEEREAARR